MSKEGEPSRSIGGDSGASSQEGQGFSSLAGGWFTDGIGLVFVFLMAWSVGHRRNFVFDSFHRGTSCPNHD